MSDEFEPIGVTTARVWSPDYGPRDHPALIEANDGFAVATFYGLDLSNGEWIEVESIDLDLDLDHP